MFEAIIRWWEVPDNLPQKGTRVSAIVCMMLPLAKDGSCSKILESNLHRASDCYFEHWSDYIVLNNCFVINGKNETLVARERLMVYGVPASSIIVRKKPYDRRIRNTFEEARFAVRLLRFSRVEGKRSLLVVANHIHMRRVLGAFCKMVSDNIDLYWVSVKDLRAYGSDSAQDRYRYPALFLVYEWAAYVYSMIRGWV